MRLIRSIKNKWLEKLDHPVGKFLAAANKYDKAHETFVTGYIDDYAIIGTTMWADANNESTIWLDKVNFQRWRRGELTPWLRPDVRYATRGSVSWPVLP